MLEESAPASSAAANCCRASSMWDNPSVNSRFCWTVWNWNLWNVLLTFAKGPHVNDVTQIYPKLPQILAPCHTKWLFTCTSYNGDLKTDHLKSGNILNPETFEIRTFWRSDFKWWGISYSPNHLKTTIQNPDIFVRISNDFWQNRSHLFKFQMVGLPDFRFYLKSGSFATQPLFDYLKSRLAQILDPNCIVTSPSFYLCDVINECLPAKKAVKILGFLSKFSDLDN